MVEDASTVRVVPGGATRQESVGNGLDLVHTDTVVVHDAARPFVTADLIDRVLSALMDADAVVAAVPVDETLKRTRSASDDLLVEQTVDRNRLWRAQTPAAFKMEKLKSAHEHAREEGFTGTDESQLIERYGGAVKVVTGSRSNLKITFPEDFALAEAMMKMRSR